MKSALYKELIENRSTLTNFERKDPTGLKRTPSMKKMGKAI
jgi:hypothetical protein